MNIMSLNIRGMGDSNKVVWINKIKNAHKIDFIGLQETRVADVNLIDLAGCWGSAHYEVEAVNPTGRSGGLICIWDPCIFTKISSTSSRYYIMITGHWKGLQGITSLVNVYAPQEITAKRDLCSELITLKTSSSGNWVFFGDFNAVRSPEDRMNSHFCQRF